MGSVIKAVAKPFAALVSPITDLLDSLPPWLRMGLQMILTIPPLTPAGIALGAMECVKCASKGDWAGMIMNGMTFAIPLGAAGALKGFTGTAGQFATKMSGKMGESLEMLAAKFPENAKLAQGLNFLKSKLPTFEKDIEASVLKANPGKTAADTLTEAELQATAPTFMNTFNTQMKAMAPQLAMTAMRPGGMQGQAPVNPAISAWDKMSEAEKFAKINQEAADNIRAATPGANAPAAFTATPGTTGTTKV